MHWNYLAYAIPFFLLLIGAEHWYTRKKGLYYYDLNNTIANISVGIAERMADVLVAGYFFYIYDYIQKQYGLFTIEPGIAWWIILFLFTDFIWYWYHRLAHEMNLLWMVHVVHHQSEDFNYSVSARITVLQALVRTLFWSILPFLGFPAPMITSLLILHGLYPFFIHTRVVGKLGVLEYILVTPSHHRVHHAANEKYLDKNYGDVLILWDKLFGTFQKEEEGEEIVYGLTKPLNTYSFLWQHFHFAIELWLGLKEQKGAKAKLQLVFGKPSRFDPSLRKRAEQLFQIGTHPGRIETPLNRYVLIQLAMLLVALTAFIGLESSLSATVKCGFVLIVLLTLINCGAIMEQKKWIFQVELIRLSLFLLIPFYFPHYPATKLIIVFLALVPLILYFESLRKLYFEWVYPGPDENNRK